MFYQCTDGVGIEMICTGGLHFDMFSGICDWPDSVKREGCGGDSGPKSECFSLCNIFNLSLNKAFEFQLLFLFIYLFVVDPVLQKMK